MPRISVGNVLVQHIKAVLVLIESSKKEAKTSATARSVMSKNSQGAERQCDDRPRYAALGKTCKSVPNSTPTEKATLISERGLIYAGNYLLSHTLSRAVPSAQRGLT
jgi:hypothetical protein